ncbi:MAG: hypothetical protein HYU66_13315 [Armatimonadetes bacterium]|nr:hypothetical protein [Armatimonadota bacterium]
MYKPEHGATKSLPDPLETVLETGTQKAPWRPPTLKRIDVRRTLISAGSFIDSIVSTIK